MLERGKRKEGRTRSYFGGELVIDTGRSLHGDMMMSCGSGEPCLLPLTSLVVLKPIKDIIAFDFTVLSKPSRDPLNLITTREPNSIVAVKVLHYSNLVSGGTPPCTALPA
ncbi:hypothetical protein F3Y22_tig00110462pilonHSYRG00172 [Hibiscus syriacus]|uniref:Uncharacterized protein n=1 Tax=Hibiscus syriacus TaxID=106335 RepID=A0A6A3AJS0_HIBSY|nr:hypothetical protein F3Y22_tig00110462pilonHSYRG00172 [Hibiscus syriacus]